MGPIATGTRAARARPPATGLAFGLLLATALALASGAATLDGYAFYVPTGGWGASNPPAGDPPAGSVRLAGTYATVEACAAAVAAGPGSLELSYSAGACFAYVNGSSAARVDGLVGCTPEDAASFSVYRDAGYDGTNRSRPANCPGGTNRLGGYYIPVLRTCGAGRRPCGGACAASNAAGCCAGEYYRVSPPGCVAACPADSGVSLGADGVPTCSVCPSMSLAKGCCVNARGCCVSGAAIEYYDGIACRPLPCPQGWTPVRGASFDEIRCNATSAAPATPTPSPSPPAGASGAPPAAAAPAPLALASWAAIVAAYAAAYRP